MAVAGRNKAWWGKGESHIQARLTEDDVREIRRLYFEEGLTQQAIADRFKITQSHAGKIICGIRWSHVK